MSSKQRDANLQTDGQKKGPQSTYREYMSYLSLGFQLAVVVFVFFLIGNWLDGKYNIAPIGKLVGAAVGMVGGFIKFFKSVASLIADEERKRLGDRNEN